MEIITVEELIEELKQFPKHLPVIFGTGDLCCDQSSVEARLTYDYKDYHTNKTYPAAVVIERSS